MNDYLHLAPYIDHTLLAPGLLLQDVERVCGEAKTYGFASVCIPPPMVAFAKQQLQGSLVKVATVIGFPFGYSAVEAKLSEVILAMVDGADELDMVVNYTAIKNNDWAYMANEINSIAPAVLQKGKLIKLILETGSLTDDEIVKCCHLYAPTGVQFLKTSTGYSSSGASMHAVALMRKNLPDNVQIKASGGIRDSAFAQQLVDAGATRLGCSSSLAVIGVQTAGKPASY